jgi:hypothetical protein
MTFYLIFSYFVLVLLVTLGCHRYLKAWLRTIYGLPIPSALIESQQRLSFDHAAPSALPNDLQAP